MWSTHIRILYGCFFIFCLDLFHFLNRSLDCTEWRWNILCDFWFQIGFKHHFRRREIRSFYFYCYDHLSLCFWNRINEENEKNNPFTPNVYMNVTHARPNKPTKHKQKYYFIHKDRSIIYMVIFEWVRSNFQSHFQMVISQADHYL